jgi:hypothetical protein
MSWETILEGLRRGAGHTGAGLLLERAKHSAQKQKKPPKGLFCEKSDLYRT